MRSKIYCLLLFVLMWNIEAVHAQHNGKCAFDRTMQALSHKYPALQDSILAVKNATTVNARALAKTTATGVPVIPVVFHIVLNSAQLNTIGGVEGIRQRITSQLAILNRDFNAENADSTDIPAGFKPLFGNTGIRFALAHTAPDGSSTEGFEIVTTKERGFDLEGGWGSGFGFSASKHPQGGGASSWDPESYMNIWVINPLEDGRNSNILGIALPEYVSDEKGALPADERGVVLHFGAFGKRTSTQEYFIKGSEGARTLVHEMGHMLELFHIWGDDDGKCPFNGGDDDGISDTPPQAYASSGCYTYPRYDGCSRAPGNGIMFMNYMDYSNDECAVMFTREQAARMRRTIEPGGSVYSLTQHPWLLEYPDASNPLMLNEYTVYPNPADNVVSVVFLRPPQGLKSIHIVDLAGRWVAGNTIDRQAGFYSFNIQGLHAGMYVMVVEFDDKKEMKKIIVR